MSDDGESRSFSGLGGLAAAATALLLSVVPASLKAAETPPAPPPAVLAVGDAVAPFTLRDQHDATVTIDTGTAVLMLTREMDGGALVKEALAGRPADVLAKAKAVYVSDISRMPSFVLSAFAMPALRKRPYPVALDTDGRSTATLPSADGKVTVLRLEAGRITALSFATTSADVKAALGL